MDNSGLGKGLFVGFIAGGVVGAVLALLYAPKSGSELRLSQGHVKFLPIKPPAQATSIT